MSEKPIASSAYTPPLTSPVTRMSWSIYPAAGSERLLRQLEGLHALHVGRPEGDLLAVLPLRRDAGGLAHFPYEVVALVVGGDGACADMRALLDRRHQLVGVERLLLLDHVLQQDHGIVGRCVIGGRLSIAG